MTSKAVKGALHWVFRGVPMVGIVSSVSFEFAFVVSIADK